MRTEIKDGWHVDISKVVHFYINLHEQKGEYCIDGQAYTFTCTLEDAVLLQNKMREEEKALIELRHLVCKPPVVVPSAADKISEVKARLLQENNRQV